MKTAQTTQALELFYAYAHEDEELRSQLDKHLSSLRRQGLIADWHDRRISAGEEWAKEINTHLNTAHIILLLVSADFLASDYCSSVEVQRALQRHKAGEAHVIPIILRPVDWEHEPFLHKLQALPTDAKPVTTWPTPPTYDTAFIDIVKGIRKVIEEYQRTPPLRRRLNATPVWNVPLRRNPFFTGRDAVLHHLREALTGQSTAVSTRIHIQAISGLGGIGKTQTALEYAYRYRDKYHAVLWAKADSREALRADFLSIAGLLQLPEHATQEQLAVEAVKRWLEHATNWLLILDNADELPIVRDFLPTAGNGHILLTTRARPMGPIAQRVELDTMDPEEGALLLMRRAGILPPGMIPATAPTADHPLALQLVKELGGLPLAIDQAGAYLEETGASLSHYWRLYQTRRMDLLRRRGSIPTDHPEPVATTWSLSFQQVERVNPAAADLLRLCAFLNPDAIPEELITTTPELGGVLGPVAGDLLQLDEALGELQRFSLLRRDAGLLSVHRLVQAVLIDDMEEPMRQVWATRATTAEVHFCQLLISQAEAVLLQARHELTDRDALGRSLLQQALTLSSHLTQNTTRQEALRDLVRVATLFDSAHDSSQ